MRMMVMALAFVAAVVSPLTAGEQAPGLVGSWKLASYKLQVVGEEVTEPFGPGAKGSLVLTQEGRWIIVLSAANRKPATNDAERAALLSTMLAYTGRYKTEGNKVTTRVDTSWNEIYTGRLETQVRFFEVANDTLTIRTPEIDSAVRPGKRIVATLVFTREH